MRNVSEKFPIPSNDFGFPPIQRNPLKASYNSTTFGNNYNKNPSINQGLESVKEPENTEAFADSGKEVLIEKEDKKVRAIGLNGQNEIVEKVKEKELNLINEFKNELVDINSSRDNVDTKVAGIQKLIANYAYKIALNRVKEGFIVDFVPLLKDIKTESFLTKIEEEIIISDKEEVNTLHERIKKETALSLITELYIDIFNYLKSYVNNDYIVNEEVRKQIKEINPDRIPDSALVKFIPVARIIFSTKHPYGYFIKNNRRRYFNVCRVPEIKSVFKENGEKWTLEETLKILKGKYPRLYLVFKNLFRDDKNITYMLNKFAYFINTYKKWRTAEVVFGVQGAGKGVFAEYFIKKIVGGDNFLTIGNSELQQQFNSFFEYKLFVVMNEIAGDITKNNVINNYLKALITEPTFTVNTKQIKQYQGPNLFNIIIFSNSEEPLKVESSDRRYNIFKTRHEDLKDVVRREFKEKMRIFIEKLDKETDEFLPILKGTEYDEDMIEELIKNSHRLKLKFDTNNKIKLLKDLILKKEHEELNKFLDYLKKENDIEDLITLEYKNDIEYKFKTDEGTLDIIKQQLQKGGFLTTEQVRTIVALMYLKDIQDKESNFKEKINRFNKMFPLTAKIKIKGKTENVRTCYDIDAFEEPQEVQILNNVYSVVCENKEEEKLKFKKIGQYVEKLPEADVTEI